jgi:HK97 family phage major capsid protein
MAIDTRELRENRHKLIVDARAILDKADKEEERRSLTAEERTEHDRIMGEANGLKSEIEDAERRNNLEREEAAEEMRQEEEGRRKASDEEKPKRPLTAEEQRWAFREDEEYRDAFARYLAVGNKGLNEEEQRALSAGTGTEGGYLYASEQFSTELIANVTDATIFRQLARGFTLPTADSLGNPTLTDRMSDAEWTSELGVPSTDTTLAFGKRAMTPHPLAKEIVVSKTLLRKVPNAQTIVRDELGRVVGEANENAFMTGTGDQRPLGIYTASADGISTARDVSSGNTATLIKFDGLKAAKYSIKQVYWGGLSWIFHRNVMEQIAKLKDGNGRYLLQDSVVQGEPDRILGFPVNMSEFSPSTMTANLYVGMLGDYSNYWIVDAMNMEITRAEELYVRTNQDLFIIRMSTDGAPVREEAFARVKLGA